MEQNQSVTNNYSNCLTPGTDSADYSVYAGRLDTVFVSNQETMLVPCPLSLLVGMKCLRGMCLFLNLPFCWR